MIQDESHSMRVAGAALFCALFALCIPATTLGVLVHAQSRQPARIIVELTNGGAAGKASTEYDSFLGRVRGLTGGVSKSATVRVIHRYEQVFYGMALEVDSLLIPRIRALTNVRRVRLDRTMKMHGRDERSRTLIGMRDETSRTLIGATRLAAETGATGSGVKVAVLDSGIDYSHPALGGGFGAGHRVVSGYDFVNDDSDPMDDNGHGTHVSGIVGSSGTSAPGVAPGAELIAVKVLNDAGIGSEADILAGLEFALDPDGDPATDDGADIVNMSLGGDGHPDDPLSMAVDNATARGVLVVVSAGNLGSYQSVASPGNARTALTVGASDSQDRIASFSSRGPTQTTMAAKPEIVAPGVLVYSTIPGGFRFATGTSMAAPQVAGAAALLMELNPQLESSEIRARLVSNAVDLGGDVWSQGAGRLDVYSSHFGPLAVDRAVVNFGFVEGGSDVTSLAGEVTVANRSTDPVTATLSTGRILPPGFSLSVSRSSLDLVPGESRSVRIEMSVEPSLADFSGIPPETFTEVLISTGSHELRIPVTVVRAHALRVTTDRDPLRLIFIRRNASRELVPGSASTTLVLPGTYDVLGIFQIEDDGQAARRSLVVKRDVEVEGVAEVSLQSDAPGNWVRLLPLLPNGSEASVDIEVEHISDPEQGFEMNLQRDPPYQEVGFSDPAEAIVLDWIGADYAAPGPGGDPEDVWIPIRITPASSGIASNESAEYFRITSPIYRPPGVERISFVDSFNFVNGARLGVTRRLGELTTLQSDERVVVLGRPQAENFAFKSFQPDYYDTTHIPKPDTDTRANLLYTGSIQRFGPDGLEIPDTALTLPKTILEGPDIELPLGMRPPYWWIQLLEYSSTRGYFSQPPFFRDPQGSAINKPVRFRHFTGEGLRLKDEITLLNRKGAGFEGSLVYEATDHVFAFDMSGYVIDGLPGRVGMTMAFNSTNDSRKPSGSEYVAVRANGISTDRVVNGEDNTIYVETIYADLDVHTRIRRIGASEWNDLTGTEQEGGLVFRIPSLEKGFYEMEVIAVDFTGARVTYSAFPAFRVGVKDVSANHPPEKPRLVEPADGAEIEFSQFAPVSFRWSDVDDPDLEDVMRYSVHIAGPGLDTTATVIHENSLDLDPDLFTGGLYTWNVEVTDGYVDGLASNSHSFSFTAIGTSTAQVDRSLPAEIDVDAYPIPARSTLTIRGRGLVGSATIDVYDLTGRRVVSLSTPSPGASDAEYELDVSELPAGLYILRITSGAHTRSMPVPVVR